MYMGGVLLHKLFAVSVSRLLMGIFARREGMMGGGSDCSQIHIYLYNITLLNGKIQGGISRGPPSV